MGMVVDTPKTLSCRLKICAKSLKLDWYQGEWIPQGRWIQRRLGPALSQAIPSLALQSATWEGLHIRTRDDASWEPLPLLQTVLPLEKDSNIIQPFWKDQGDISQMLEIEMEPNGQIEKEKKSTSLADGSPQGWVGRWPWTFRLTWLRERPQHSWTYALLAQC